MKKEIKNPCEIKGKYQVNWRDKDDKGYYDTFIIAQDRKEAEIYAKTVLKNGAVRIQITLIK
jgi:hypothetical protein